VIKYRGMRWAEYVAHMKEQRGAYRNLVGKPERKVPLRRPMPQWEDNNKMDIQEVER
jgi:sensor domain CHASE-containing protein